MEPPEASSEPPRAPLFSTEADQPSREDSAASGDGGDDLFSKAQRLMERITASRDNPSPAALHALASMLESEESRYMEETGYSSLNNERASHGIGQLGNLIRENDEFFDLISTRFLSETRYSITVQAAATRLLLSCSLTWTYPHIFEETVLDNIKKWVMDDTVCPGGYCKLKHDSGDEKSSNSELLWTYSTGLLVVCLFGGDITVEDALTSGLSAKLMHHLRSCVLGEKSTSHKGSSYMGEKLSSVSSFRGKGESRTRVRQVSETTHMQDGKLLAGESVPDQIFERDHGKSIEIHARGEECWLTGGQQFDGLSTGAHADDVDADGESLWHGGDLHVGKTKFGECDENVRDDSRSRVSRGWARMKGKGWINEEFGGNEQALNFPGPGGQLLHGRITKDRSLLKNSDGRKVLDVKKSLGGREADGSAVDGDHNDDLLEEFIVGSKDISKVIKKAVLAAEAEARVVSAPSEAIKAAGDAAAELVKGAAVEEFQATSDEDAAFLAASKAALTVIDAATAVEMARSSNSIIAMNSKAVEPKIGEENEDYILPDRKSLVHLKEKYCIQCLEILGEYVEVLGPILHEKGVDVCLALLQQTSKPQNGSEVVMLLPDVLKLICVLAAHRKFAALFVDRGGVQKLIAVPRVAQTFFGLSSCLYTIGSLQGIMEHVCALPSDVVHHFVGLALQLLECPQDQARKNAALFFATSFVFRAVIDSFDVQDGLLKVLGLLHDAASVRSGVNSGAVGLSTLGSLRDRSPSEILTSSEKQIAYHSCVALRQYFRAHLLLLVDSIRPSKSSRSACRNIPSVRAAYKPFDISNEAIDVVLLQLQKDRKLGPVFVRAHWPAVDKFLASNGHITMLELCQAPPVERYLGDLLQYALGVLHIVTLVPYSRKLVVNCILSNNRVGIAVILDAANSVGCIEPDIIQPALNVLVNLVCPPPSISNKPPPLPQTQQSVTVQTSNLPIVESRERNAERNIPDRVLGSGQSEPRERSGESSLSDRGCTIVHGQLPIISGSQTHVPAVPSRLVGDRRISLGIGAGSAGLAAQLEQGYHHAREAVRANNGIKVLLHLLQPRIASPPATLDCLRALACRVLLGLARDDTIAQILTKLQVGKRLSELIRDSDNQIAGTEQGRWQAELMQVAIELIAIVTNLGRATSLAATDAATPTLRRIERAAIAAATPIAYHSRELLLLIHEHLQASGLAKTAVTLLKEAQLTPLPSLTGLSALAQHASVQENPPLQLRWPCGRCPGFLSNKLKVTSQDEDSSLIKCDSAVSSLMKNPLVFSSSHSFQSRNQPQFQEVLSPTFSGVLSSSNKPSTLARCPEVPISPLSRPNLDVESQCKTPILLPLKRKLIESKDACLGSSAKRLDTGEFGLQSAGCRIPIAIRKSNVVADSIGFPTPRSTPREQCGQSMHVSVPTDSLIGNQCGITHANQFGFQNDPHPSNIDRLTLDSLVVQYLKHQHRQCTAPITTLPPLSLLHPHNCPEPRRSLDAPANVTARIFMSEFKGKHGGMLGNQRDRQLVYSRFRPWRTCRHEAALLTCLTFLGNSSHIAAGSHSGELKVFDSDSNNVVESCTSHQSPLTRVQSCLVGEAQLVLSSSSHDVRLWDASSVSAGPMHSFQGCKSASFSNSGTIFAALPSEQLRREVLLYDTQTFHLESTLSDTSSTLSGPGRGHAYSLVHFSPLDTMLLWNGVLWDPRIPGSVHRFDQFTDYGGGGFHPAGNEVIINSEVWDLRKFRLLRSVPSLDQTVITFNPHGDVIYAILRRNLEDITSAVNTRRFKHQLFAAFRTIDAVNYSDIATTPVDRCVLDFATEPTDSFVGLVTMDDQEDMFSSARVYEIGRRRPTDDDSDPDDVESEDEEEEDVGDSLLGSDFDDGDSDDGDDDTSNDEDGVTDDDDMDGGGAILEILDESDDDDSELMGSVSSEDEDDLAETF